MNFELAKNILNWGDHEEADFFEEVTKEEILQQSRWYTYYERVYKDIRDGSLWKISWKRGSTEMQDDGYEDIEFCQVVPKEVIKIVYVPVENKQ